MCTGFPYIPFHALDEARNNRRDNMNKSEQREIVNLTMYHKAGMSDTVARGLSALIRASMTKRSRAALIEYADIFGVRNHPEFLI